MPNGSLDKFISEDVSTKMDCETLYNIALGVARGIISMLDARETVGYIAPEAFSKSYGAVSHKSDVYSYGMVVLELIGSGTSGVSLVVLEGASAPIRSRVRFPLATEVFTWIPRPEENNTWSETNPCDRPPMKKVVDMLEGGVEALVVPPKPLLTPAIMAWETVEESEETSSLLTLSQLDRF
uniref:Serine-threonine/tyrosine-protein kinase catalytic domain-containing protein n=1 Tax=Brassica oleracea var. oleracea TaxID=109376 RepID=A0A0D3DET5_BRAOL